MVSQLSILKLNILDMMAYYTLLYRQITTQFPIR